MSNTPPLLPFGLLDLDPAMCVDPGPPLRVRCVVQGCREMLLPPTRGAGGDVCPAHQVRVHRSGTYSYPDPGRNVIVAKELLATRIVGNRFKVETHRFGYEKSEDALTFSVMRSFQQARCLNYVARYITGLDIEDEPRLYLWGLDLTDDSLEPWALLVAARRRFERRLPVKRPATEPDIGLFLDGHYLVLCEAKFTSPNTHYADGPRRDEQALTKNELLEIYQDPLCRMLDTERARDAGAVASQLWRNTVFAQWMAAHASPGTRPYFVNLVRRGHEIDSFHRFSQLVRPEFLGQVNRLSWEDLWVLAGLAGRRLATLREFLVVKSANLVAAFRLDPC
jgi:hypothetical protein